MTPESVDGITEPALRRLYDYWRGLHRGSLLPRRGDLDPAEFRNLLEWFFIYDVVDDGRDYRVRLAGAQLCAAFGREMRGLTFDEIHPAAVADEVRQEFDGVVSRRLPHCVVRRAIWNNNTELVYERLAFPLAGDGDAVEHIAGASVFAPIHYLEMDYYR